MSDLKTSFMSLIKVLGAFKRPKGITSHLYKTIFGLKGHFSLIPLLHSDLMIATSKVNLGKDLGPIQLIKHVI